MPFDSAIRAYSALGAMILTLFGCAWLTLAGLNFFGLQAWLLPAIGVPAALLFLTGLARYRRHRAALAVWSAHPEAQRRGRALRRANNAQWIAIGVVVPALALLGQEAWILPAIVFIVGAHFLPLARALDCPTYYLTGAGLIATALAYPALSADGAQSPLGAAIAGAILWATATARLAATRPGYSRAV